MNRRAFQKLLPKVKDRAWFFDTELLYAAQREGLKLCQIPVTWIEDDDSRVQIKWVIVNYILNLLRLRLGRG